MDLGEHVLFVHAHPDDETLSTGAAIATIAASGVASVLTLTLGERGEVRPERRAAAAVDGIASMRSAELDAALAALGATRIEPAVRYEDSGMRWVDGRVASALDVGAGALSAQPRDAIEAQVLGAIDALRPSAVVTYDDEGGYGHPDHVLVHEATAAAARAFDVPLYVRVAADDDADVVVPLEPVRAQVDAALRAHASQLHLEGDEIVHVGGQREAVPQAEGYRHVRARIAPGALTTVVVGALGLLVGVVGTVSHRALEPWGLVLALVALLGVVLGPRLMGARAASIAGALGVLLPIAVAALDPFRTAASAGLVGGDAQGWAWVGAAVLVAAIAIGVPGDARRPRAAAPVGR